MIEVDDSKTIPIARRNCPNWRIGSSLHPWKKRINPHKGKAMSRPSPWKMINRVLPIIAGVVSDLFCRVKIICGIARTPANIPHSNNIIPMMLAQFKDALTIFNVWFLASSHLLLSLPKFLYSSFLWKREDFLFQLRSLLEVDIMTHKKYIFRSIYNGTWSALWVPSGDLTAENQVFCCVSITPRLRRDDCPFYLGEEQSNSCQSLILFATYDAFL